VRRLLVRLAHLTGPIALRIAGSGLIPVWGVLHHTGRKSGKAYATPLAILDTPDGLVLPLPFGERTDWCRNVRASGGGILHWRGADHRVVQPEVIDAAIATPALNAVLRRFVRVLGIKRFLRVRRAVVTHAGTPTI
jgi:deazaflavin-dependent oxidoreductase (nitroreductase family)